MRTSAIVCGLLLALSTTASARQASDPGPLVCVAVTPLDPQIERLSSTLEQEATTTIDHRRDAPNHSVNLGRAVTSDGVREKNCDYVLVLKVASLSRVDVTTNSRPTNPIDPSAGHGPLNNGYEIQVSYSVTTPQGKSLVKDETSREFRPDTVGPGFPFESIARSIVRTASDEAMSRLRKKMNKKP